MCKIALIVHILYAFKKCAKTSISGSNLESALFALFQKTAKTRKIALFVHFLFQKYDFIRKDKAYYSLLENSRNLRGWVFWREKVKIPVTYRSFGVFFYRLERGWFLRCF